MLAFNDTDEPGQMAVEPVAVAVAAGNGFTVTITDEEVADEDFMDAFRDEVSNLAWSLGLTWAGEDSYDDFTPGEIDFWEASNC